MSLIIIFKLTIDDEYLIEVEKLFKYTQSCTQEFYSQKQSKDKSFSRSIHDKSSFFLKDEENTFSIFSCNLIQICTLNEGNIFHSLRKRHRDERWNEKKGF